MLLRESVEVARNSPGRLELALSLVKPGTAECRANRKTAARSLLEEGMALARSSGADVDQRANDPLVTTMLMPRGTIIASELGPQPPPSVPE